MLWYLDTSAAVKLVVEEPESHALRAWLTANEADLVAGDLLTTELIRATRRAAPSRVEEARAVLDAVTLVSMPPSTFEGAALIEPGGLRSLDALHLAVAMELQDDLDGMVTYDVLLGDAARALDIAVAAPG